jgi:AraC-like DNA-binding protein
MGEPGSRCWCLFLEISALAEFRPFLESPLAFQLQVEQQERFVSAFSELSAACGMPVIEPGYPAPYALAYGRRQGIFSRWQVRAALLTLLAPLLDDTGPGEAGRHDPPALARAQAYMAAHYAEADLSLAAVASAAAVTPGHLGRLFREHAGTTPLLFLKNIRMMRSRFLLERTNQRVAEVAYAVGFSDPLHFSRVFKAHTGLAPRHFRAGARGDR